MEKTIKILLSLLIIIVLTAVIVYAILPYINYFFGAFILYIVFRPVYNFLVKKSPTLKANRSSFSNNNFSICCFNSIIFSFEYNYR